MLITRSPELISPGPERLFKKEFFRDNANLRNLHKAAFADFDRAKGKFGTPSFAMGIEFRQKRIIDLKQHDVIVQVEETEYDLITNWAGDILLPLWRVRIAKDPNHRMRGLKEPTMRGPCYNITQERAYGPFVPMSLYLHQVMQN